jgi:hypothetical protein
MEVIFSMDDFKVNSYKISKKAYGHNVNKPSITPGSIQAHIDMLMPNIPMGTPRSNPLTSLNATMFANDSSCRPTPASVISQQNYVTVPKWENENPSFPNKDDGTHHLIRYSTFLIDIVHGDIRKLRICKYI